MLRGELLQEICGNRVWSPAFQVQYEVIDHFTRIVNGQVLGQVYRKISPEYLFGKLDVFQLFEHLTDLLSPILTRRA